MLSTDNMSGVVVTPSQLGEMQADDYILHARDGVLNKVPVEKIRMPLDPQGHYQGLILCWLPTALRMQRNTLSSPSQRMVARLGSISRGIRLHSVSTDGYCKPIDMGSLLT